MPKTMTREKPLPGCKNCAGAGWYLNSAGENLIVCPCRDCLDHAMSSEQLRELACAAGLTIPGPAELVISCDQHDRWLRKVGQVFRCGHDKCSQSRAWRLEGNTLRPIPGTYAGLFGDDNTSYLFTDDCRFVTLKRAVHVHEARVVCAVEFYWKIVNGKLVWGINRRSAEVDNHPIYVGTKLLGYAKDLELSGEDIKKPVDSLRDAWLYADPGLTSPILIEAIYDRTIERRQELMDKLDAEIRVLQEEFGQKALILARLQSTNRIEMWPAIAEAERGWKQTIREHPLWTIPVKK